MALAVVSQWHVNRVSGVLHPLLGGLECSPSLTTFTYSSGTCYTFVGIVETFWLLVEFLGSIYIESYNISRYMTLTIKYLCFVTRGCNHCKGEGRYTYSNLRVDYCCHVEMSCIRHVNRVLGVIHPWLSRPGCSPPLTVFTCP